jgi:acetyl esterase/lipase
MSLEFLDIPYDKGDSSVKARSFDLYTQDKSTGNADPVLPLIVFVHGGAWRS